MGIFNRRRVRLARDWVEGGETPAIRAALRDLCNAYERALGRGAVTTSAERDFWGAVQEAATAHAMIEERVYLRHAIDLADHRPRNGHESDRRPAFLSREQSWRDGLARGRDLFASRWGLPGGLLAAYEWAERLNRKPLIPEIGPSMFACSLVPRSPKEPAVFGDLAVLPTRYAPGGLFLFTLIGTQDRIQFKHTDVARAEALQPSGYVLRFTADGAMAAWSRAEFHSATASGTLLLERARVRLAMRPDPTPV